MNRTEEKYISKLWLEIEELQHRIAEVNKLQEENKRLQELVKQLKGKRD